MHTQFNDIEVVTQFNDMEVNKLIEAYNGLNITTNPYNLRIGMITGLLDKAMMDKARPKAFRIITST